LEELGVIAVQRQAEPRKLNRQVRGELDWIVMKAMEKDRDRRYATANGFAFDLQRYLNDEPVIARPPSMVYRFQKLVRRNKLAFGATVAVVAALLVGLGFSTYLYFRARTAEQQQSRLRQQAEVARQEEVKMRQQAEANEQVAKREAAKNQEIAS